MKVELRLVKQVAEKCHSKLARMTTFSHPSFPRADLGDCDGTTCCPSSAASGGVKKEAIRKGHFAVVAASRDGEVKRFVIALSCLRNPAFLRLLDEAEEEFGWSQQGVLSVLCRPSELEDILAEHRQMEIRDQRWSQ
uniref:SAUR family protein n=1 Tax=Nymphaea colorata TaxID=210225 RepID=A0A5K0YFF0_9MAGN|nr:unnamed protein product [Nymphaea colorata]